MVQVLVVLIITAGLLVWGRIRSDVVALCSMLALVLMGIITPQEGLAGFSSPVVIMIAGLFIVGGAITQTELARTIGNKVLSLARESEMRLFYLVILCACMMPLATAMDHTGLSSVISGGIVSGLGAYGPYAVLAGMMLATQVLSMFISNTATAVLFAPIALQAAVGLGVDPLPFMICVTVSASMCFMSPIATTPNAMVMSVGRYSFLDYVRVGLPLQVIILVAMVWLIPMIYPL